MVAVAAANGALAGLIKPLVNRFFVSKDPEALAWILAALPAVLVVKSAAVYLQIYYMSYIGQRVTQELRRSLFVHLHALSMDFFWRSKSGEVLSRVTHDLTYVQSALHFLPLYFIRDTLTVAVLLGVLLWLNPGFALLALVGAPAAGAILGVLGRKLRDSSAEGQKATATLYHRFQESLQGMLVVKAFHFEDGAIRRFDEENDRLYGHMMRYLRASALSAPLMELLGGLLITLLLYVAGRQILAGALTPGDFSAFLGCFLLAYSPLKNLAKANAELQRGLAAADRIYEILDERPGRTESEEGLPCRGIESSLELRSVSFRYPGQERWALRDLSLVLRPGEVVGVAGPSGSGKSTLVHLLLRLFDPTEGRLLLDGRPLPEYATRSLRSRIGLVTQDTLLFHDTVAANVALGRPGAPRSAIEAACRQADADGFIRELPQGYDTVVGERGLRLSGGQRQRLAIARALLKDPALLLLDEATSNLDSNSERAVQLALERAEKGRTTLVVAHRLSTLQDADRILVLADGGLVESGTHARLLAANGLYAGLWRLQAEASPAGGAA